MPTGLSLAICLVLTLCGQDLPSTALLDAAEQPSPETYAGLVLRDGPVAYWRFDELDGKRNGNSAPAESAARLEFRASRQVKLLPGPRPAAFPLFDAANEAVQFDAGGRYLIVDDPGAASELDFAAGDEMTLEAWVSPTQLSSGRFYYVIGKGRTGNQGFKADNQNYALRLKGTNGGASLSFLFRSAGKGGDWHRWTSAAVLPVGDGWHHVAVTYKFGDATSIRGYVDGEAVSGVWDMGGATSRAPVVDDDQLWIGSSMGGQANSTFHGGIDEVAIYRETLTTEQIRSRYRYVPPPPVIDLAELPEQGVLVQILEGVPDGKSWKFRAPRVTDSYVTPGFVFLGVPKKYSERGIHVDRSNPFLIRAMGRVVIPPGENRMLVRCRNASRLYVDGRKVAETPFHSIAGNAHGRVIPLDETLGADVRPLRRGDTQRVANVTGDGKSHLVRFEMIVGGRGHRPDFGETGVFLANNEGTFHLLSDSLDATLDRHAWPSFLVEQRQWLRDFNTKRRRESDASAREYWASRHELARRVVADLPPLKIPPSPSDVPSYNDIDRLLNARLAAEGRSAAPLLDDLAFLRRVTLDAIGLIPSESEIARYLKDPPAERRTRVVERLLDDPRWADHWVSYWQDVLAENPNIINPTLNNTGPFRWWIHESLLDNKPLDRFVTELVMMEGSEYFGGPAGFGVATQNDVPMAAKANILGQAFLGLNMKCARCHDAPFHDVTQEDLFSLAAMLKRSPQTVPASSSIPGGLEDSASSLVQVNLKPGSKVTPAWTFSSLMAEAIPGDVLRDPKDTRERLAALITLPENRRFAQVMANRIWMRFMGRGLVEPVDDWEQAEPTDPVLLDFLARELASHGYDAKHVARLIFHSHVYQRASSPPTSSDRATAAPLRRRMTAEQLVDSLFIASGQPFDAGPMNIDIDGSRSYKQSLDLGVPTRAWHFASLSNERDRPSLSLPFAQPFITLLESYGWRSSRQDPLTRKTQEPNPLQPAVLANGVVGRRVTTLTEDSQLTALALSADDLESLIERTYSGS